MLTIPKRSLILTLLLFGWGCHQSGDKLETSKSKAFDEVGGTSRELKPITASMVINCSKYYEGPKRCNSAVLGKKEGITTAHCLFYKDPETSQFATVPLDHYSIEPFGTGSLEACQAKINSMSPKDGTDLKFNFLEKFYIHPMFIEKYSLYHILSDKMQYAKNPTQHWRMHRQAYELRLEFTAYDVAVLIFEQEVPWQVAPSKIPGKNEKIIQDFVEVAGYNAFSKEVPYGQATLERIEARPPLSSGYRIIIGFDGQGTACNGDSGGPVGRLLQDNKTIGLYGLYEGGGQACGKSELKASPNFVHDLRGSQNWIACKFRKAGRPPLPSLAAANQKDPFATCNSTRSPKLQSGNSWQSMRQPIHC